MKALCIVLISVLAFPALSSVEGEAWKCSFDIQAEGYRVGFIVGAQSIEGKGTLECFSDSSVYNEEVYLYIGGFQFGFSNVSIDRVRFVAHGFGIGNPEDFFGKYNVGVTAGASLDEEGNEVDAVFALKRRGFGLEVGAMETRLSRQVDWLPLVDVFGGIKAIRFSQNPID